MKHAMQFTVRWHDTNANREMTPSAILTLMQETTNSHIQTLNRGLEYVRDVLHQAFVLTKIYMRFYEPIHAYDELTVETWTGVESRGFTFYRNFHVLKEGRVVADALTLWALIDTQTHKLLTVSEFENNFIDEESLKIDMPRRIKYPKDVEMECLGNRKIMYSDIDYNRHMNNTHYPSLLVDYLPSPERYKVKEIMLSFVLGAMYNDEITIHRVQEGDTFYFKTHNPEGKVCLEAFVKTAPQDEEIK